MSQEEQESTTPPSASDGPSFTEERHASSGPRGHKRDVSPERLTPPTPAPLPRAPLPRATLSPALPPLAAALGAGITLTAAHYLLPAESGARAVLTRSALSQAVTLGLFFWGLTVAYGRLLAQRWEREQLTAARRLAAPSAVSDLLRRVAERAEPSLEDLRAPLAPLSSSLAGRLALSGLTALHEEARRASREGGARLESVMPAAERALDSCHADVHSEYKTLTAILWLVPLSGFLGTVVGMSAAISSFDVLISGSGANLSSLAPAVAGLATAFDTTLVALSLVVPLKLIEVTLERADGRLLSDLDAQLGAGWLESLDLQSLSGEEERAAQRAAERAREADIISSSLAALAESARAADERLIALSSVSEGAAARLRELAERGALQPELARRLDAIERHLALIHEQGERPLVLSRGAEPAGGRR